MLIMSGVLLPIFALGSFLLTNQIIMTVCIMGLGATFSVFIVAALTIPMELPGVSAGTVGIVTAAVLTIGNLAGVVSPIFVGLLTDFMGSYVPALSILALTPLTLVLVGVLLPETGQRGRQVTP
jgi:cyanate permease